MDISKDYTNYRAGYVTIIGRPNSGKSTLMNALLNYKLSIVTHKPQTTRQNVLGILSSEQSQIVFLDTPGLLTPRYKLQEAMLNAAKNAMKDADVLFFLTDATQSKPKKDIEILKKMTLPAKPIILVFNKIDLIKPAEILPLIADYNQNFNFDEIIPISALKKEGLSELMTSVSKYLPLSPPFYPEDELSDAPERFFVAELIREKIFMQYGEEIPYSTTVHVEEFKERKNGKDYIRAAIFVERATQRRIIIGTKGKALKQVGQAARAEIETMLDRQVFLELWVVVRENWRENPKILKELGYIR